MGRVTATHNAWKGGFPGFLTSCRWNGHGRSRGFGGICDRLNCLTFSGSFFAGDPICRAPAEKNPGTTSRGSCRLRPYRLHSLERMDTFNAAEVQATEEAALNALVANRDMICRDGSRTPASSPAKQKSPGERTPGLSVSTDATLRRRPRPRRFPPPKQSSSGSARRSGRGRPASSDDGPPDSPCSRF